MPSARDIVTALTLAAVVVALTMLAADFIH